MRAQELSSCNYDAEPDFTKCSMFLDQHPYPYL